MAVSKKSLIALAIAFSVFAFASFWFFGFITFGNDTKNATDIQSYAKKVALGCADAPYRPTCYETEVPKLVTQMPTEEIFLVIRELRKEDPEYLYCHVLAHNLGKYEVSLDPDNWLDVIAKGPTDGLCSNGFAHGAIVARFSDEDLSEAEYNAALQDLSVACEERKGWNPTDLTKAICYHGIGHVLIHMTLAEVSESLHGCEVIGLKDDGSDYRQLCTEGVYMQLFQPLEPEDYALVDMLPYVPTRETLEQFCTTNSSSDEQYGACWREAWPLFGNDIYTSEGVTKYCGSLTEEQNKNMCYVSAFTLNGRSNLGNPEKMAATCNGLEARYKGDCFARGANAFPEEDPAFVKQGVDMCGKANTKEAQDECYGFLAQIASFNFHRESPAFEELCTSLPQRFENTCRGEE